jgi:hypothetical protein
MDTDKIHNEVEQELIKFRKKHHRPATDIEKMQIASPHYGKAVKAIDEEIFEALGVSPEILKVQDTALHRELNNLEGIWGLD